MKISGGEAIARLLQKEGVEKVFGIIDGTYFGLYSNLKKYGIDLITPRHETTAAHMAGAYARLSGKLGVCIASNGPGVANVLPGIAVENAEGNRVLLITSCRRHQIIYPDRGGSYQCFDQVAVMRSISKYSEHVSLPERIVEIFRHAIRKSYQGRPGVVHVDVPEDFLNGKIDFQDHDFLEPGAYRNISPIFPSSYQVEQAVELLMNSKTPIIHAGSGVIHSNAFSELERLAHLLKIPVTTSWGARGVLGEKSDLSIPMIHIALNDELRRNSDLVLVIGSRVSETDWWGKMPHWGNQKQKWIQVDIDEEFIGRSRPLHLGIVSDAKIFLQLVFESVLKKIKEADLFKRNEWIQTLAEKKNRLRAKLDEQLTDLSTPLHPAHVASICQEEFDENAVVILDGGNTAIWGHFFHRCSMPGNLIGTPKMGMLGAGQGHALGAKVARPDRQVYAIMGDGAMGFHMQEIETAVRNKLDVVFIVLSDRQWGMVKMNQQYSLKPIKTMIKKSLAPHETINADFEEIKWDQLAESMGAHGERASSVHELRVAIKRCKHLKQCSVIHVDVDPVKHMWAPGLLDFKKMHAEPSGKRF